MDMFIFIIGFLAILVGLVLLVFNLIKKTCKEIWNNYVGRISFGYYWLIYAYERR